ncbi:MAG TPA: hypothetical protein VNM72_02310 [Blastocatellia bacterium]|nr:hypothetical protein [Blastocatellia bacterium]
MRKVFVTLGLVVGPAVFAASLGVMPHLIFLLALFLVASVIDPTFSLVGIGFIALIPIALFALLSFLGGDVRVDDPLNFFL